MTRHSQRKLSNVKLTKKYHFRYSGWWIFISLINVVLLVAMVTLLYEQITRALISPGSGIALGDSPFNAQVKTALILAVGVYVTGVIALGIFTAHRLAGPYLALMRTFRQIKEGNFSARLHFRTRDDLDEVEGGFNEMMNVLEAEIRGKEEESPLLKVVGE